MADRNMPSKPQFLGNLGVMVVFGGLVCSIAVSFISSTVGLSLSIAGVSIIVGIVLISLDLTQKRR